ncbi:MAG: hypothetical protein BGO69_09135 [Bacteroidetes bacterium 46-16]|nr:MAG: hypothetical protein BGO69_09135 [Bacteroidetes bacterium 46-16]
MAGALESFIEKYTNGSTFTEERNPPKSGGSKVSSISLPPDVVFELLEVLYGSYEDANAHYIFIDDKTRWERYFRGPNGLFRVYDYRGHVSIGSQGLNFMDQSSVAYRGDIEAFREMVETAASEYPVVKGLHLAEQLVNAPMNNFSRGFLGAKILLERAKVADSLLELLVLNATVLDATLRLGIILATQLREKNDVVPRELIIQESKAFISERKVYSLAKDEGILDDADFTEVSELYDFRNVAIHRYFISGMEYREIEPMIDRYETISSKASQRLRMLEDEQVAKGIGMTKAADIKLSPDIVKEIQRQELLKIDSSIPVAIVPKRNFMFKEDYE